MRFTAAGLAADLGGVLEAGGPVGTGPVLDGLAIDSRELRPGQLFAAVRGSRDGHDFVADARRAGAAAVLVSRVVDDGPSVVVPDVERALVRIAGLARRRLPDFVVGVTGSVGKTTTKDMLANVLAERYSTAASLRSFNNELGVPLTLANASEGTEAVVVEMGARGHGHISLLCSMAHPTVGVVTAVQAVHTEHMGGEVQIALAKRELVEHLAPSGLAVLHAADPLVAAMAAHTRADVLTFGGTPEGGDAGDVWAERVHLDDRLHPSFRLHSPWGGAEVTLGARGAHNVANALAAAAVALHAGLSPEAVAAGLARPLDSPWRMELLHGPDGLTVLNDAYNAGPASMEAALRSLAMLPVARRLAVVGVMAELGERAAAEHAAVAELARQLGVELVAVGTELYGVAPLADAAAAVGEVRRRLAASPPAGAGPMAPGAGGAAVLVKGSRVAGLEAVAHALAPGSDA
jgi:UDP-N-acetylmuramoyl-tripeptide--D-alanyl-D-alanine ligase